MRGLLAGHGLTVLASAAAATAAYATLFTLLPQWAWRHQLPMDILAGLAAMGLIGYCASFAVTTQSATPLVRMFQSRFAGWLAGFSYSLYLMHWPVLSLGARILAQRQSGSALCAAVWFGALPASVAASYGLYWCVERHFIRH